MPMKVKAIKSFGGIVSMRQGEVRDINDLALLDDLMGAKLVESAEEKPKATKPKTTKKRSAK